MKFPDTALCIVSSFVTLTMYKIRNLIVDLFIHINFAETFVSKLFRTFVCLLKNIREKSELKRACRFFSTINAQYNTIIFSRLRSIQ